MAEQHPKDVVVNHDIVQIEFVIEDLIKHLVKDKFSLVASCNGCKGCKAAVDLPAIKGEK